MEEKNQQTPPGIFKALNFFIFLITGIFMSVFFRVDHAVGESKETTEKESSGGFIKKDEYLELNAAVEQLSAKVKTKNENLKKLLLDKDNVKDSLAFKDIIKQIEIEYREIKDLLDNIEKKKTLLRHRFPERSLVKSGEKMKEQNIEEITVDEVVEKKVKELLKLVDTHYKGLVPSLSEPGQSHLSERAPANIVEDPKSSEKINSSEGANQQNSEDFSHPLLLKK